MGIDDILGIFAEDEEEEYNRNESANEKKVKNDWNDSPSYITVDGDYIIIIADGKRYYTKPLYLKNMLTGKYKKCWIYPSKNNRRDGYLP